MDPAYSEVHLPWLVPMHAELVERLVVWQAQEEALAAESEAPAPTGSFVAKQVSGRLYWYVQTSTLGRVRQVYFGPDSEAEQSRRTKIAAFWMQVRQAAQSRRDLCRMLRSAITLPGDAGMASKVLQALHQHGLAHTGAVVVGTHAFLAYQMHFGLKWSPRDAETQDLDLASETEVALVAAEPLQLWPVLQGLQFQPARRMREQAEPAVLYVWKRGEFRVDVLTPMRGDAEANRAPRPVPNLGAHAEPLRYMDFLTEDPILTAFPFGAGVLAHVPQPARFALHKLIVASRPERVKLKAAKDVRQAGVLLNVLLDEGGHDLRQVWARLGEYRWQRQAWAGIVRLPDTLQSRLRSTLMLSEAGPAT